MRNKEVINKLKELVTSLENEKIKEKKKEFGEGDWFYNCDMEKFFVLAIIKITPKNKKGWVSYWVLVNVEEGTTTRRMSVESTNVQKDAQLIDSLFDDGSDWDYVEKADVRVALNNL